MRFLQKKNVFLIKKTCRTCRRHGKFQPMLKNLARGAGLEFLSILSEIQLGLKVKYIFPARSICEKGREILQKINFCIINQIASPMYKQWAMGSEATFTVCNIAMFKFAVVWSHSGK